MLFKKEKYRDAVANFSMDLYRNGEYQIRKISTGGAYSNDFSIGDAAAGRSIFFHNDSYDDFTVTYNSGHVGQKYKQQGIKQGRQVAYDKRFIERVSYRYFLNGRYHGERKEDDDPIEIFFSNEIR